MNEGRERWGGWEGERNGWRKGRRNGELNWAKPCPAHNKIFVE